MDTVTVTIGGEAIVLPAILNFAALKRAWPGIKALGDANDAVGRVSAAVQIAAAALNRLRPELTAEEIAERLKPTEMAGLVEALPSLLGASGLVPAGDRPAGASPSGEAPAGTGSTAISTR